MPHLLIMAAVSGDLSRRSLLASKQWVGRNSSGWQSRVCLEYNTAGTCPSVRGEERELGEEREC